MIKKDHQKYMTNHRIKDKVVEIEEYITRKPVKELVYDDEQQPQVLLNTDRKTLSNTINPVVQGAYEKPINSQQIFHQTQVDMEEQQVEKVKLETFLNGVLQTSHNTHMMNETIHAIHHFVNDYTSRYRAQIGKLKRKNEKQSARIQSL